MKLTKLKEKPRYLKRCHSPHHLSLPADLRSYGGRWMERVDFHFRSRKRHKRSSRCRYCTAIAIKLSRANTNRARLVGGEPDVFILRMPARRRPKRLALDD